MRLLALAAVCLGALGLAPAASAGSERVEVERTSGADCGPCPAVVFNVGSGAGELFPETTGGSGQTETSCAMGARAQCSFYIDEFANTALLRARPLPGSGTTFGGWIGCPKPTGDLTACGLTPGAPATLCAFFKRAGDPTNPVCPPPSIALYKKADGLGTVTASGPSGFDSCDERCPLRVMTKYVQGEIVRLTATASSGSTFVRWDGCPAAQGSVCDVTLTQGFTICSVFVKDGASAPTTQECPYTTPPIVPPPPKPKPPRLGSRCTIPGSRFAETIRAPGTNDVVCARGGNDRVYGRGGHDLLLAGAGHDRVYGGSGYDRLRGDAGNDKLYAGGGADIVEGASGNDVFYTRDRIRDTVRCGRGRDVVYADRADRVARDCEVVRRTRK